MRDDDIIIESDPAVLVPDGDQYLAIVVSAARVTYYQRLGLEFLFQLVGDGVGRDDRVPGYCPFTRRAGAHTKLHRWVRAITAYTHGSPSKVPLNAFRQYLFRVRIETVTKDSRQQPLPTHNQYSTVTEILEVIGPLKRDG